MRRQTDRENQLQTRYSNLLYERGATYSQMQHRWKSTLFLLRRFQGMKCLSVEDFLIHLKTQITSDINVHLQITDLKISISRETLLLLEICLLEVSISKLLSRWNDSEVFLSSYSLRINFQGSVQQFEGRTRKGNKWTRDKALHRRHIYSPTRTVTLWIFIGKPRLLSSLVDSTQASLV